MGFHSGEPIPTVERKLTAANIVITTRATTMTPEKSGSLYLLVADLLEYCRAVRTANQEIDQVLQKVTEPVSRSLPRE
jgi:hypothetical protein